ncbi:hypothetical protein ACO2Q2_09540 [Dyella sp. KRB-257]|uniref:hypothetical protein n=1 Tax=Dyella sp. KRB-257 TaxID=3400915 RepID=UPI003BFF8462
MSWQDLRIETDRLILRPTRAEDFKGWAFDQLGWTEVIHTIAPDHLASQEVARRLGSSLRGPGHLPEPFQDLPVEVWGQSWTAWKRRRA